MSDQHPARRPGFPPGYLASHPVPPGIAGALGLGGYQLLVDVAGVGAGRLGPQAFLMIAADPDPSGADPGTQISLHHKRLKDDAQAGAFVQLAAELGYLRLSGYRLAPVRSGLRSKVQVVNPATGAIALEVADRHAGLLGGMTASGALAAVRSLPPAGPAPDTQSPEVLSQILLALALRDESTTGEQAAALADRALQLALADRSLDPQRALEAAKGDRT